MAGTSLENVELEDPRRQETAAVAKREPWKERGSKEDEERPSPWVKDMSPDPTGAIGACRCHSLLKTYFSMRRTLWTNKETTPH